MSSGCSAFRPLFRVPRLLGVFSETRHKCSSYVMALRGKDFQIMRSTVKITHCDNLVNSIARDVSRWSHHLNKTYTNTYYT